MDRKQIGRTNKTKGSNAERLYAQKFRSYDIVDYNFCKTSREGSKLHDNAKIDLIFIPYNIQIKAGKQKNMNPGKELLLLKSSIYEFFPTSHEVHNNPILLIHYEEVGRGRKRLPEHEKVYMSLKQFEYFRNKNPLFAYDSMRELKFDITSEFKIIVCMTFEHFEQQIILKQIS